MIVPDLKRVVNDQLKPLDSTGFSTTTSVFARKTGIFGRKSRHAAILQETGPKRSVPTAVGASVRAATLPERKATQTISYDTSSSIITVPEITAILAEIEGRQVQASRSASEDVTTIRTTAIVFIDSSTTRTILTEASMTIPTTRPTTSQVTSATVSLTSSTEATPTTSSPPSPTSPTSTFAPSAKTPVGAIAGGAIGGFAALLFALFLIAFLVRRHRKKIEKRRLAEANPFFPKNSTPPPPIYQARPGGHNRSNSTSHDIYGTMGGIPPSSSRAKVSSSQGEKGRLIDMNSLQANPAPGLRAEGGPGLPPAAFLRPAQMLDGRPINEIGGVERPRSGSRGNFKQHVAVEMEDTSSLYAASPRRNTKRAPSSLSQDSPILGRSSAFSSSKQPSNSLVSNVTRSQHLMSWSTYASDGNGEEMSATLNSAKTPPSARSSPSQVSEQSGGQLLLDSTYVVSSLRKGKF